MSQEKMSYQEGSLGEHRNTPHPSRSIQSLGMVFIGGEYANSSIIDTKRLPSVRFAILHDGAARTGISEDRFVDDLAITREGLGGIMKQLSGQYSDILNDPAMEVKATDVLRMGNFAGSFIDTQGRISDDLHSPAAIAEYAAQNGIEEIAVVKSIRNTHTLLGMLL